MWSSSIRDFRIVGRVDPRSRKPIFRIEWRWRHPRGWRDRVREAFGIAPRSSIRWRLMRVWGIYEQPVFEASTPEDAEALIDTRLREDDPMPWVEVTRDQPG